MKRQILTAVCLISMLTAGGYAAAADDSAQSGAGNYGPGMMGGGYGMGPGMMGGGYGMGPGMMNGGYGMMNGGFGMMGGGYGMGPGMMMGGWGYSLSGALNLSDEQQKKIQKIQEDLGKQQWTLMQALHTEMMSAYKKYGESDDVDVDAVMKTQTDMSNAHLQMLRNRLEAQKKIRDVLTKEQREKLNEMSRWGW